ncbi:MAG: sigma-54-dependent Fis family transcriptional regulator [Proteobacteria bacterium]|nr:sigma-54-dependent Fis family transcriptional regulator [Pseudomonadota bacterium]
MVYTVLVVDDNAMQLQAIASIVRQRLRFQVVTASSGREAIRLINSPKSSNPIDVVLIDVEMPEMSGIDVIRALKPAHPELPFIVVTAHSSMDYAVQALQSGASDFILKHEPPERIETSVLNALQGSTLRLQLKQLERNIQGLGGFKDIIGTSRPLKDVIVIAQKAAASDIATILKGESGVGKELFARIIHGTSARAGKPFVAVNCGAIPENLLESTLFGHEKGAFTGAVQKSLGKFREAEGGTLFLDEIAELTPAMQVKLLRALQEKEVEPVGGGKPVKVDVRFIFATNRDLKRLMVSGKFREDLYYRVNVFPVHIPSLRVRGREDIAMLLEHFTATISAKEDRKIHGLTSRALETLCSYEWPGNVRQLQNAVLRAIVLSQGEWLDAEHFSFLQTSDDPKMTPLAPLSVAGKSMVALSHNGGDFRKLAEIEADVIRSALTHYDWHISEVARRLGIGRSTLYRRMEELAITQPEKGGELPPAEQVRMANGL